MLLLFFNLYLFVFVDLMYVALCWWVLFVMFADLCILVGLVVGLLFVFG